MLVDFDALLLPIRTQLPGPSSLKSYRAERGQLCAGISGLDLFADLKCVVGLDESQK